jgi:hypothetical protein
MPAVQTAYSTEQATAFVGMLVNTEPNNLISLEVQTAAIGFGKAVKQGTADKQAIAATAAADVFRGVTVRDQSAAGNADEFPVGTSALVMQRGVIWVRAGGTCTVGTAAYMIVGTGEAGNFTSTSTSNLPIVRGTFDSTAASGALVKLRIA